MSEGQRRIFGIAAEFATEWQIVEAAQRVRARGFGRVDAMVPLPIPQLSEALGFRSANLRNMAIAGSLLGLIGYFAMAVYGTMSDYPFLIAGRPAFSWPYYVIPSVSIGMLAGALVATFGMLFFSRLPRLYHPVFNIDGIERATKDRFFLTIEAADETFDFAAVEEFLRGFVPGPLSIQRVPE